MGGGDLERLGWVGVVRVVPSWVAISARWSCFGWTNVRLDFAVG